MIPNSKTTLFAAAALPVVGAALCLPLEGVLFVFERALRWCTDRRELIGS